jgi:hypothetical protein
MACYTARIELHAPTEDTYQRLDRAMATAGFARTPQRVLEPRRSLDPAEYLRESDDDLDGTFEAARDAASQLDAAFTILVCESSTQKWIGLRVSTPA